MYLEKYSRNHTSKLLKNVCIYFAHTYIYDQWEIGAIKFYHCEEMYNCYSVCVVFIALWDEIYVILMMFKLTQKWIFHYG